MLVLQPLESKMRSVLVTGGNQGIGFALCKQLAIEHNCHVYLTARNPERGEAAVSKIASLINDAGSTGSIDFIELDTSDESSIKRAAATTRSKLSAGGDKKLYGIVNNAGIGLNTASSGDILTTNLYGPKRVCENFLDVLDPNEGRVVNLGSGSGPMYVGGRAAVADKKILCSPDREEMTWDYIERHAKENLNGSDAYELSKALLACYTGLFARQHPNILSSCVSPGFINTQMTSGWGASKSPEDGTVAIKKCLFEELQGNGWYYGSDGLRSPYHFMRNPGEVEYDGVNPFL
mmetsp:Transcript_2279/g.2935  ORF Transcript_2279/g.2935 Transcript_2279/m.2935 type:complete len:292 (+) Transcript_2279:31-906(+)